MAISVCTWNGGDVDWANEALVLDGPLLRALAQHCRAENGYLILAGICGMAPESELALYEAQLVKLERELAMLDGTPFSLVDGWGELCNAVSKALDAGHDLALRADAVELERGPVRVPVLWTIAATVSHVWGLRLELGRVLLVPLLIELASIWVELIVGGFLVKVATLPIDLTAMVLLGVNCHRVVLLGPDSVSHPWGLSFGRREVQYLFMVILVGAVTTLPMIGITSLATFVLIRTGWPAVSLVSVFALPVMIWVQSRLLLILPAAALDERLSLRTGWEKTRGHGLRLMAILMLASAPTFLLAILYVPAAVSESSVLILLAMILGGIYQVFMLALGALIYWTLQPTKSLPRE